MNHATLKNDAELVGGILQDLVRVNPDLVWKTFDSIESEMVRIRTLTMIQGPLINAGPDHAAELLERLPEGPMRANLLSSLAQLRARRNVSEALKWALELENPLERVKAEEGVLSVWVTQDFEDAIRYVMDIPDDLRLIELLSTVCRAKANQRLEPVIDFPETLESRQHQIAVFQAIANDWAEQDPEEAALFGASLPDSQQRNNALRQIILNWARKNPNAAANFALQLPKSQDRNMIIQSMVSQWVNSAPQGAVDFARDIRTKDSSLYDEVLRSLIYQVVQFSPQIAVELVMAMEPNSDQRVSIFSTLAMQLAQSHL